MIRTFINKISVAAIIACFILTANSGLAKAGQRKILVFGDSLVAGYGLELERAYPAVLEKTLKKKGHDVMVLNHGVSGDTSSDGVSRIEWSLDNEAPDFIIVELGANDMLRGISSSLTRENLDTILYMAKKDKIPIMIIGIKASPNMGEEYVKEYDIMYKNLAEKYKAVFYPFFLEGIWDDTDLMQEDNLHPNAEGIEEMVDNTLPYVEKLIGGK